MSHALILSRTGKLYGCGGNEFNQLGLGSNVPLPRKSKYTDPGYAKQSEIKETTLEEDRYTFFSQIPFPGKIRDFSYGLFHSMAVDCK
jgi:alpha-tubulin suppressor-like RCC1 family protein